MTEEKDNNVMQTREEVNRLIDGLTLFDDDLMSRVFDKNIAATELILRIILGRKIKVIRVNGQEEVRNSEVGGRNITLDQYPENAFFNVGTIDDVIEKAKTMSSEE